jgi:hypothetical protein
VCLQSKNTSSMDIELEFFKGQRENPIYAQPLNKTKESPKRNSVQRICMYARLPPRLGGSLRRFMTSITSSHLCRASQDPAGCRTDGRVPDACRSAWHWVTRVTGGRGSCTPCTSCTLGSGNETSRRTHTHADTNDGDLGRS